MSSYIEVSACRSSPILLNDKIINTRVFLSCMAARKFGFTQSYGRSCGGIVLVFIEFTVLYWHFQLKKNTVHGRLWIKKQSTLRTPKYKMRIIKIWLSILKKWGKFRSILRSYWVQLMFALLLFSLLESKRILSIRCKSGSVQRREICFIWWYREGKIYRAGKSTTNP